MNMEQIVSLGPELADFLDEFSDCFGRWEPRCHMAQYVRGQLSELPRKSVEPIALAAGIAPRTLQEFLRTDVWDHSRMRDRVQQIVVRDHDEPQRIGIIDDSGHPKKGRQTACVNRQYCGRSGKIDNCVISVHLTVSSFDTAFRAMVDSTPYLPNSWHEDRARCEKAGIPDDVVYRPKYDIALEQLDRAATNGLTFDWITADIWYSEKPRFLAGLLQRSQRFVLEIPRNLSCWSFDPGGQPSRPASTAENLCRHWLLTQVSRLFLSRQANRLRGEKSGGHAVPDPPSRERIDRLSPPAERGTPRPPAAHNASHPIPSGTHRHSPALPYPNNHNKSGTTRNQRRLPTLL